MIGFDFLVDFRLANGMFAGRNVRVDIPVGAIFTQVTKTRTDGPISARQNTDLGVVAVVNLTLQEVEWYRRQIDLVPAGHTAGIRVAGDGIEVITKILETKSDTEYIHLRG